MIFLVLQCRREHPGNRREAFVKIREQGGELRLAGLNADLQTLFELTKLDTLFAITRTAEEALAAF